MAIADRYEPTGGMKAGGMSEAHLCDDLRLNRPVILKTLRRKEEQRRLADEKKSLLKLRSNHVVQLLDIVSFVHQGETIPCLVLEYISGDDLSEGIFDVDHDYLGVLWQIAKGLGEIHQEGVVHRDIKPNNIRRDKEGVIKIIDFGLSREVGIDNKTRASIGYLPYMAPELLRSGEVEFSTEADVFAYAVVALSITKNGLPEWCRAREPRNAPTDLVSNHLPGLDPDIQNVLQRCLLTLPSDRPKMSDVIESVEGVLLRDRHRARIVIGGKVSEMSSSQRTAKPTISSAGTPLSQLEIHYDGNSFVIRSVVGTVLINNMSLSIGDKLPKSCVLAFKGGKYFYYATFDVSNPEYMI